MKYVSIDLETTGLDPFAHQVLEIGAIIEDTDNPLSYEDSPKFSCIINHASIYGSPRALEMNARLLDIIATYNEFHSDDSKKKLAFSRQHNILSPENAVSAFFHFIDLNYSNDVDHPKKYPLRINCAGKNFAGFDKLFLNELPGMNNLVVFKNRVLDPAILWAKWDSDKELPGLNNCKKRCGMKDSKVSHVALDDAWDVICCLRPAYIKKK